jgi:hypothetical protein
MSLFGFIDFIDVFIPVTAFHPESGLSKSHLH